MGEDAFRRFYEELLAMVREGVLTPDIYDPALNPLYRNMLVHYGAVALPCRVGDPAEGEVESAIGHTQATPLKGLRFESLAEAQAYLDRWETRWADTRIHGTTKRQVAAMFAEERPALLPLPVEPFRYYRYGTCSAPPPADQPSRTPPTTVALLARATRAGARVGRCARRSTAATAPPDPTDLGVLPLVKKYGPVCARLPLRPFTSP